MTLAATQLDGVLRAYQNAVQQAWLAAGAAPVAHGYDVYGPNQVAAIVSVEHQAGAMGTLIGNAATAAATTDYWLAENFKVR